MPELNAPATDEQHTRDLEERCVRAEGAVEIVRYLAQMMTTHSTSTIRVYGEALLQAIDDPDAWQAAIAAKGALPIALALDLATPSSAASVGEGGLSSSLSSFVAAWSEVLGPDSVRVLGPLADAIDGAAVSESLESIRAWRFADWTIRQYTAFWLEQVNRLMDAARVLGLRPVRNATDLKSHALPVLSAIADQLEAERERYEPLLSANPRRSTELLDATLLQTALSGAEAAFEASAIEPDAVARLVDAAQTLWIAEVISSPETATTRLGEFTDAAAALQLRAVRLLKELSELRVEDQA
jgi:hypothetical protein